jgi:hypothetical protein
VWGIFNSEGCIENGFVSANEAKSALSMRYDTEDELHIAECCHDHPEEEREYCQLCNEE